MFGHLKNYIKCKLQLQQVKSQDHAQFLSIISSTGYWTHNLGQTRHILYRRTIFPASCSVFSQELSEAAFLNHTLGGKASVYAIKVNLNCYVQQSSRQQLMRNQLVSSVLGSMQTLKIYRTELFPTGAYNQDELTRVSNWGINEGNK